MRWGIFCALFTSPLFASDTSHLPLDWSLEITGADLAKEAMSFYGFEPVDVFVSDNGVKMGESRGIDLQLPLYQPPVFEFRNSVQSIANNVFGHLPEMDHVLKLLPEHLPTLKFLLQPMSDPMHASHVAGTIGSGGKLFFPFGVSDVAKIYDIDIFRGAWGYPSSNFKQELTYLLQLKTAPAVINMSHELLSDSESLSMLRQLCQRSETNCVLAAGNRGQDLSQWAAYANLAEPTVVVGALSTLGTPTYFSDFGGPLTLLAPGEDIVSYGKKFEEAGQSLAKMTGTSMAAPFVSGTLANLRAILPHARSSDLKRLLEKTSFKLGTDSWNSKSGAGLVNAFASVMTALQIYEDGYSSAEEIASAVTQLEKLRSETLLIKFMQHWHPSELSLSYWNRASALLKNDPEAFQILANATEEKEGSDLSFAWQLMAVSHAGVNFSLRDFDPLARKLIEAQQRQYELLHLSSYEKNIWSYFEIFQNKKALERIYELLPPSFPVEGRTYLRNLLKLL